MLQISHQNIFKKNSDRTARNSRENRCLVNLLKYRTIKIATNKS